MTKYWVLTMIGAIGLAALIHPERLKFLRSPAPWVAIATLVVAMIPHLVWLKQVDFVPLTYAGDVYSLSSRAQSLAACARLYRPQSGAARVADGAGGARAGLVPRWWTPLLRQPSALFTRTWSRGPNPGVNRLAGAQHLDHPGRGRDRAAARRAWSSTIYMKTDWGISLFFLMPLALVAIPALRLPRMALFSITAIWLVVTLATLAASPCIAAREMAGNPATAATYGARSELARELTQAWHARFHSRWAVVAGTMEIGEPHDVLQPRSSGAVHAGRSSGRRA